MVLCGMVVNPDGTVAGAGPLGQLPAGALGAVPGTVPGMVPIPSNPQASFMPDLTTIAAWGAATMMGKGVPGMKGNMMMEQKGGKATGGFGMQQMSGMPKQPLDALNPSLQGFMRQPLPSKGGHGRGKGRNFDVTTEHDWESLGRQRQQGEVASVSSLSGKGRFRGGFTTTSNIGTTMQSNQGRYPQPFADPTDDNDWNSLGRQRDTGKTESQPETEKADPKKFAGTGVSTDADDAAPEDKEIGMFDGEGRVKTKMVDTLKDLQLKVEKPVAVSRNVKREEEKDWAMAVPEDELAWHNAAAEAAKSLEEMKAEPVLDTAAAIALAQRQAEERVFMQERQARRQISFKPSDEREVRSDDEGRAEEYRAQQAEEARQERQRVLAAIERQKQKDVEREARLEAKEAVPKLTWSQARALKQQQQQQQLASQPLDAET